MDFKLFIKSINVTKLFNLALIEKNYIFEADEATSVASSCQQAFLIKWRSTLHVFFENSHVSQAI